MEAARQTDMDTRKAAPRFLNLLLIKLPPGGIASIAHRVSGVLLFLCIPLLAYLFSLSLDSDEGFQKVRDQLATPPFVLLSLLLVWSLSHHLLAGVRHLLLDIGVGIERLQARTSAWLVNIGALLLTGLYLVGLL